MNIEKRRYVLLTRPFTAFVLARVLQVLDRERVEDIGDTLPTKCMTARSNAWLSECVHTDGALLDLSSGIRRLRMS